MRVSSWAAALLVGAGLLAGTPQTAVAQQVDPFNPLGHFIYPGEDQTAEQAEKDKSECYAWASEANGFDPYAAYQKSAAGRRDWGSGQGSCRRSHYRRDRG